MSFIIVSKQKQINQLEEEHRKELDEKKDILEYIQIQGNSYSKIFFEQLAQSLKDCNKLNKVNVNDIFVGRLKDEIPDSIKFLGDSFIGKPIVAIDISNNAVNPFGAKAFSGFLEQASFLKILHINNCGLGPEGVEIIAQSIGIGAKNLEVLSIGRNRAENKGVSAVGLAVAQCQNFRELHIYQDVGREPGMVVLIENLRKCKNLELLDIQDNFLKNEAANQMSLLIQECPNLRALNLSDCNMEEEENEKIIAALQKSDHKIEKLGYNYDGLTSDQAIQLLDALLKSKVQMVKLDITGNEFKSKVKKYYKEKLEEAGLLKILSAFDEEDDDEQDPLIKQFANLTI